MEDKGKEKELQLHTASRFSANSAPGGSAKGNQSGIQVHLTLSSGMSFVEEDPGAESDLPGLELSSPAERCLVPESELEVQGDRQRHLRLNGEEKPGSFYRHSLGLLMPPEMIPSSPQSLGLSRTAGFPSGSAGKESACSAGYTGHFTSRLISAGEQKELGSLNKERRTSGLKLMT